MRHLMKSATSAVLSLSLALPLPFAMPAYAQENLPQCTDRANTTPLPCLMGDRQIDTAEQWRVFDLIARGRAQNVAEAREILAERRADQPVEQEVEQATETPEEPALPVCGDRVDNTPLPCMMGDRQVETSEQWRVFDLIARGQAANVAEAREVLAERRAEQQQAAEEPTTPALPACGDRVDNTPLPCMMGDRQVETSEQWRVFDLIARGQAANVEEARAVLAERRAEPEQPEETADTPTLQQCGTRANNTPLPCQMGERRVETAEQWRVFDLVERGLAGNVAEAREILAERRAEGEAAEQEAQQADTTGLQECTDRVTTTPLPCQMGERRVETAEQWRVFDLVERDRAANVAEAREILAARRAQQQQDNAAADATDEDLENAESETVTEGDVRSADEEYDTRVTATGQDSGGGLSNFEKVLLLGLGAVVVGSILNNGDKVVSRTGDRVVVETPEGDLRVLKDDDALLRRPGDEVQTRTFDDGSTRTIVRKPDGSRIITVRGRDGSVIQRVLEAADGTRTTLIDDTADERQIVVEELPDVVTGTRQASLLDTEVALRNALSSELQTDRQFSLRQIREIREVRALAPEIELDAIRFASGSAAIQPEQARALARIGTAISDLIARDPSTVLLVEGHTDAVGDPTYNLALSDRRAETVALALTEYFNVPPENMVTQGYGEYQLKVPTLADEAANRRAVVRNITGLLR